MYAATTVPMGKKNTQASPNRPDADKNHDGGGPERRIAIQATSTPINPMAAPRMSRMAREDMNPAIILGSPESYKVAKSVCRRVMTLLARLTTYTDWRMELATRARDVNLVIQV